MLEALEMFFVVGKGLRGYSNSEKKHYQNPFQNGSLMTFAERWVLGSFVYVPLCFFLCVGFAVCCTEDLCLQLFHASPAGPAL